jgi:prenyltransferase beta subunit
MLARSRATGGFLAAPLAPIPDLLSTATAIHALALAQTPLDDIKQPTLEFIDSLWSTEGAFAGNWLDETLDCEYTYYGLLALGHLNGE